MGVETEADLAGFFNPDEFGTRLAIGSVEFNGIDTTGFISLDPAGLSAGVSAVVPRIICLRSAAPDIQQGDLIAFLDASPHNAAGALVTVNDLQFKGALLVIHYHTEF